MQPFEHLIFDAWNRLKPALLANPAELARRLKRRDSKTFSSPPRAWCLAVRACDHRIGVRNGRIEPEYATDSHDPEHPGRVVEHTVTLTAELLHELCCPVRLTPGGELCEEAAKKLGTTRQGLTTARISGTLQTRHVPGLLGRRGRPIPIVSTSRLLDACAGRGFQIAHPLWIGNEYVSARIPNDFAQTVMRMPAYRSTLSKHQYADDVHPEMTEPPPPRNRQRLPPPRPDYVWYKWSKSGEFLGNDPRFWRKCPSDPGFPPMEMPTKPKRSHQPHPSGSGGSITFSGWRWLCPTCHRMVRILYMPAPPEGVLKDEFRRMKDEKEIDSRVANLLSSFIPHPSSFACFSCHRLRYFSPIAPNSWNELISYFTAGLLRGKDIPKPDWFSESAHRKLAYRPRIRRSPRRELLLELILQGDPASLIATKMHLSLDDICSRISQLCKRENVANRAELAKKHGRDPAMQPNRREKAKQRRQRVLDLLVEGFTTAQIAIMLAMSPQQVQEDIFVLCRKHGVKGRRELMARFNTKQMNANLT